LHAVMFPAFVRFGAAVSFGASSALSASIVGVNVGISFGVPMPLWTMCYLCMPLCHFFPFPSTDTGGPASGL
jgi:hypothetical protein